jgi:hypothetical protein
MNKPLLYILGTVALLATLAATYITSLYWRAGSIEDARAAEEQQLEANADAYYADVARATEVRLAKEAADTYGGTTPEETWSLFIAALEQEDVELAVKYFVVDKQEEVLKDLIESKRLGNIIKYAKLIDVPKTGTFLTDGELYEYRTKSTGVGMIYTLQINPQTHVWKILSL